jgi:predicted nucleic acid-binding protein
MKKVPDSYVIDASVVAKWYLNDENLIDKAEDFLVRLLANEIILHAPEILRYELGHLLISAKRQSERPIDRNQCEEAYRTFCELPIIFHQLNDIQRQEVLSFANDFNKGFYDSSYIWLAGHLGCQWVTAEKRLGRELLSGYPVERVLTLESLRGT